MTEEVAGSAPTTSTVPPHIGRRRQKARIRHIYFVQAKKLRLIKIGVSNDAGVRLGSLQTFSPDRLILLGVIECEAYGGMEADLHGRFARYRSHGEWFHPCPPLLEYIAEHTISLDHANILAATRISVALS